jgi:hypothetical protein
MKWFSDAAAIVALVGAMGSGSATLADKGGGGHGGGGGGGDEGPTPTHTFQSLGQGWIWGLNNHPLIDINASGMVVGGAFVGETSQYHALLIMPLDEDPVDGVPDTWFKDDDGDGGNDLIIDLGYLAGVSGIWAAYVINDSGWITGTSDTSDGLFRGFVIVPETDGDGNFIRWNKDDDDDGSNDLMIDVGPVPPYSPPLSWALEINTAGCVVGQWEDAPWSGYQPYIIAPEDSDGDGLPEWFRNDGDGGNELLVDLQVSWRDAGYPTAINENGWVVGEFRYVGGGWRVDFVIIPEDTDGDGEPDNWFNEDGNGGNTLMFQLPYAAADINDLNQILMNMGVWQIDPVTGEATLLYDLEDVPNSLGDGSAYGLNKVGGVVGTAFKQKGKNAGQSTPLYWQDGVMYNLFDLMMDDDNITDARAELIDDSNRILGWADTDTGSHAFIAVPIPSAP